MMQARYHPNYGTLASRIVIDNHQKTTPSTLLDCVEKLYHGKIQIVSDKYHDLVCKYRDEYESMIDYSRDFKFDYFGFKTLERAYLLKSDGIVFERPQHLWMRVAIELHEDNFTKVRQTYDALSEGYFVHATPTLFNAGTLTTQLSSCFLLKMSDDSIKGIYKTLGDCAQISKWAGGIGLSIHNVRARNARIRGTNGESTGIVPMLKVYNDTAKYVNQGGKRNGSFAVYLEPWHADIEDFLKLRLNQGAEEERARDLFYGMWIPDLFMKRVEANSGWTLMCPSECPGLDLTYGDKFEELYTKYEAEGRGRKVLPAQKIWTMILDAQIQTGNPYLCYKDAANLKSNQKNIGVIKSSNLCAEIMEFTSEKETAVCNLGSVCLPKFVEDGVFFNFRKLREYTYILAQNLDVVIDRNFYPTPETKFSNQKNRPIGIGVQGLADVFAMLRIPWTSAKASELNALIFENMYYGACQASIDRAEQLTKFEFWRHVPVLDTKGHYPAYVGSPTHAGKFQFDLWGVNPTMDWDPLREKMAKFGIRNSLLIALMPTASTSQIMGNNECFEPFTSNIYTRRVLAGDFMVINKYLVEDLIALGLWTSDVRTQIIANGGSVQGIVEIPVDLQELYKTVWEIPQKTLINMARDRAPFVCQSQSLNLFLSEPTYAKISSMHMYAWKCGLKTGCYYLRTKGASTAQKFTVEPCLSCSA